MSLRAVFLKLLSFKSRYMENFKFLSRLKKLLRYCLNSLCFSTQKNLVNGVFASISVQNIVLHTEINNLGIILGKISNLEVSRIFQVPAKRSPCPGTGTRPGG